MASRYDPQALISNVYGKLTVREFVGRDANGNPEYRCVCSCPAQTERIVKRKNLVNGNVRSCGCLRQENRGTYDPTRYCTAEAKRARALRDQPVSYKIVTHR
jgi:hypothetical protein